MEQEDKNLLLKDLSARLPYGVKVLYYKTSYGATTLIERDVESFRKGFTDILIPYLRPMSSMTEEEREEYEHIAPGIEVENGVRIPNVNQIDWLNAHHFDYRGLIEKGLAIAVTEENNPYKE